MLFVVLTTSSILYHNSGQSLRVFNIHRLHVAVQLLFRTFLVISLSRYPHAQSVRYTFDTCLPDLLVELRVQADVFGSLALGNISVRGVLDWKGWRDLEIVYGPLPLWQIPGSL